jgi:hypothetical protein
MKETVTYYGRDEANRYDLSRAQRLDLVYYIASVISYDIADRDIEDEIREVADSHASSLPYIEIRNEWASAGYPDPYEFDYWSEDDLHGKNIHALMELGLALAYIDWAQKLFAESQTRIEALELANSYLSAHGWNTYGRDGIVSSHGTEHGK